MSFNALETLREAGVITAKTSQPVLDVLSELNEDEARLISSLDARIKAAMTPEVVAQSEEGEEDAPCAFAFSCGTFGGAEIT
jgi:hypothetical protein